MHAWLAILQIYMYDKIILTLNTRMMRPGQKHLEEHYADLSKRPFFPGLVKYMDSGPVVAMCWEGQGVVKTGRVMLGETNPKDSKPGTIRGDYCIQVSFYFSEVTTKSAF